MARLRSGRGEVGVVEGGARDPQVAGGQAQGDEVGQHGLGCGRVARHDDAPAAAFTDVVRDAGIRDRSADA